jgi:hypothetical protein
MRSFCIQSYLVVYCTSDFPPHTWSPQLSHMWGLGVAEVIWLSHKSSSKHNSWQNGEWTTPPSLCIKTRATDKFYYVIPAICGVRRNSCLRQLHLGERCRV